MPTKPQVLAWLTCDAVHIDPATGKHTILGVFSNIRARQFPVTHPQMAWFLSLGDVASGQHTVRLSIGLDAAHTQPLVDVNFQSPGPLAKINLAGGLQNVPFAKAGDYAIVVEVDNEPLLVTSIGVSQ
jgi:hypothetical protein